ncbi:MAG: hypothetical protein EA376_03340 [Phycisphaeraceae bacterium]|nr:MAG: hypothetical protein EA376_03340 [Phycisphaeraceae bacterium]
MKTDTRPFRALFPLALALLAIAMIAPGAARAQDDNATDEQNDEYVWPELRVHHVGDLPVFDRDRFQDPVDVAMYLSGEFYAMNARKLGPGLIAIYEPPEHQAAFAEMMNSLRAARGEPVALRIAIRSLNADEIEGVQVGSPAPAGVGRVVLEHQQVAHRGLPTRMHSTKQRYYVSDYSPVVGSGAVGHNPTVATVSDGLALTVYAGVGRDERTDMHIDGELTRVLMNDHHPAAIAAVADNATLHLPSIDRRSITSAVSLRDGEETIIAIVQSPEKENGVLAITATVRALGN